MIFAAEEWKVTKRNLSFIFCLAISSFCFAQDVSLEGAGWGKGSIILNDQTELKGYIKYNAKKGSISFKNSRESKVFYAGQILGFEIYNLDEEQKQLFYSLRYNDKNTLSGGPHIFELLKQFKAFAILQRADQVDVDIEEGWKNKTKFLGAPNPTPISGSARVEAERNRMIYLFPTDGKVTLLLATNIRMIQGRMFARERIRNKLFNKELLIKCMGEHYAEVKKYARKKRLDFDNKDDLMKIFSYYEAMVGA